MKKNYVFLVLLIISTLSFGQRLLDENFDNGSTSGDLIVANFNWVEHLGGTPNIGYATNSLVMPGYQPLDIGGSASLFPATGQSLNRPFFEISLGTVYMSALVNISAAPVSQGGSGFFLHLNSSSNTRAKLFVNDNGSGGINFGILSDGPDSNSISWGTTVYNYNSVYLIVASYNFNTGTSNLYVLDTPVAFEPNLPEATQTAAIISSISSVSFHQHENGPLCKIDALRVATNWSDLMDASLETVSIPDSNFENYLETHNAIGEVVSLGDPTSMGDGVLNNFTLKGKVDTVTSLNVNDSNIASLQGIEAFTSLEILFCQRNQLAELNVSQNTALTNLECESNQFTTLDVSNNTALKVLGCAFNNLSSLDVSNNLLLEAIWFTDNNIQSLNLDVNTALKTYGLSNNPLVYMSIKNGNNANIIYIEALNLPSLSCIQVDDANAATYLSTNFSFVDSSISFSQDCGDLWTVYTSDANVDSVLSSYGTAIDTSGDGEITLNEAAAYTGALDLSGQGITDIQGLQAFTSVTEINLSGNNITDLSALFGSNTLILTNKRAQFKTVANASFTALSVLNVSNNSIASLDLSDITTLVSLNCSNNLLNSLNVKNGNNAILTTFDASNNTSLNCIQVDNATDASSGAGSYSAWNKDAFAIYSEDCSSITLSIDDKDLMSSISLYPNPIKNVINLKTNNIIDKVEIYNLLGQKIEEFKKVRLKNNQIDVSTYPSGFYILNAEINGATQSIKFLKE
jgi:Leucine-rich repeat (LRR) protein